MEERAGATRTGLTLDELIDAALAIVSVEGFEALTMRRLARDLEVGPMTLYGYVRTKEELLAALANRFLAEIEPPAAELPWRERLAVVFRGVRRVFLAHPALLPIAANQRIDAPAAYAGAEVAFAALAEAGLTDDSDVVAAFGALASFTVGATQRESAIATRVGEPLAGLDQLDARRHPQTVRLAGALATREGERDFELGLAFLIDGIAARAGGSAG